MSTIGPIGSSIGSAHVQVLQRAQEALKPESIGGTEFTDRIGDAINQVADAQSKSAKLAEAYETGAAHDIAKGMVSQQESARANIAYQHQPLDRHIHDVLICTKHLVPDV